MARLADVPVREVEAVCLLPELVPLLRLWLGCEPELDSPCDVSPEERDDDEVLAVCVVPVPCASPPDDVLELVVVLELLLELLVLLELVLLDELLLDGSAAVVVLDDDVLALAVWVLLPDVDDDDESGAELVDVLLVLDGCELAVDVVLLELVEDDVSLGAALAVVVVVVAVVVVLLVVGAVVVAVGAVEVVVGVSEMVIGALTGTLSDVENATVDGATVVELVVVLPVVVVLVLCVAVCTAACPAVTAVCTVGFETGLPMIVELNVPSVVGGATTVVGMTGPVSVQLVAVPASVSELVTATCSPLTGVLLESVAVDALTGPPAAMVLAVSERLLAPASIVAGVSVPRVVNVIPPPPVAVTGPAKLLLRLESVIALLPAWRLVVPVTEIGPLCVTLPAEVSERLPALLEARVVAELSTSVTVPVVFTATVPKLAVPCVSEMAPPPVAVRVALPPMLSRSVD